MKEIVLIEKDGIFIEDKILEKTYTYNNFKNKYNQENLNERMTYYSKILSPLFKKYMEDIV